MTEAKPLSRPAAPRIGMAFDRNLPPTLVIEFARRLDAGGATNSG